MVRQSTRDPEAGRDQQPAEHAPVIGRQRMFAAKREDDESSTPDLHRDIGNREDQAASIEGAPDRGGHDQGQRHRDEQHAPDRRRLWIEPVGDPAGILPTKPDREPQDHGLHRSGHRQVVEQLVAELRDREDIDEIEKQLLIGHTRMMSVAPAQERMVAVLRHSGPHFAIRPIAMATCTTYPPWRATTAAARGNRHPTFTWSYSHH